MTFIACFSSFAVCLIFPYSVFTSLFKTPCIAHIRESFSHVSCLFIVFHLKIYKFRLTLSLCYKMYYGCCCCFVFSSAVFNVMPVRGHFNFDSIYLLLVSMHILSHHTNRFKWKLSCFQFYDRCQNYVNKRIGHRGTEQTSSFFFIYGIYQMKCFWIANSFPTWACLAIRNVVIWQMCNTFQVTNFCWLIQ